MLVDLARNDLSRNCHDVHLDFYKEAQYYSHVIHLVSRVSGELDEGADPIKTFVDTFPAGTLSGAPKVKSHAAHQRNAAAQPRRIRRMHRIYRIRRIAQPGHHHPHFREPQQRTLVSGWRRNRGQKAMKKTNCKK